MMYSEYRIQDGYKHLINGVFRIQGGYKSFDKWFILNTGRIQVTDAKLLMYSKYTIVER